MSIDKKQVIKLVKLTKLKNDSIFMKINRKGNLK